jgi:hypothetical protein
VEQELGGGPALGVCEIEEGMGHGRELLRSRAPPSPCDEEHIGARAGNLEERQAMSTAVASSW